MLNRLVDIFWSLLTILCGLFLDEEDLKEESDV